MSAPRPPLPLADPLRLSCHRARSRSAPSPASQPVDKPFMQFFTQSTKQAYDGITSMDTLAAEASGATAASSESCSCSGVSSGAAAGIGIGCALAGMIIGAAFMHWWGARRSGWKRHGDPALPGSIAASDGYKL